MSLSEIDLPAPLAPRMIFVCPRRSVKLTSRSTTASSKASDTFLNAITGWSAPDGGSTGAGRARSRMALMGTSAR